MKNIDAGVGALPTQEKNQEAEGEGKKYIQKENEVIFCLEEAGIIKEQKVKIEKIKEQEAYIEAKNSINNMVKIK